MGIYGCVCVSAYLYVGVGKIRCSVLLCDVIHCAQDFCTKDLYDDFWTILRTESCIPIYIYSVKYEEVTLQHTSKYEEVTLQHTSFSISIYIYIV